MLGCCKANHRYIRRHTEVPFKNLSGAENSNTSIGTKIMKRKFHHRYGILACLAASSSALNAGFAISFSSPAIQDLEQGKGLIHLTPEETTWFGSLLPLTAMCGSLLSGPLMDYFGRRPTILMVVILFLVSWITMFFASGYAMLFSGRGLSGLATGMSFAVIPVYISEVSPAILRGTMGSIFSVLLALGLPVGYCVAVLYSWRGMAESGAIIACLTFVVCYLLPESPYWLLRQNKNLEATKCLKVLRGSNDVAAEVKDIQALQQELSTSVTAEEIFSRSFMKPMGIGIMLMVVQQFSGVNAVFFYSHEIFQRTNFHDENVAGILVSSLHVAALIVVTFTIDRFGRRILLLVSAFGMMICHAVNGACMYIISHNEATIRQKNISLSDISFVERDLNIYNDLNDTSRLNTSSMQNVATSLEQSENTSDNNTASLTSLLFVMLYIAMYSVGFGPIPFIALSEMLPQRGRGVACGIGTMCNWICAFTLTKTFVQLVEVITITGAFWLFSSVCFLSIIFIWRCVPETKGKTLSQIQDIFASNTNFHMSPRLSTKSPVKSVNQVVMASPLLPSKRSSSMQAQMMSLVTED
ncbi:facilitated trehalose transporter Tret1-2 homolog isoform X1 [Styela clava]